jgi:hypothetical protein
MHEWQFHVAGHHSMRIHQVVCMKWGDKFHSKDVNRLHRMVRRHLGGELRMVCMTDAPIGIDEEIRCVPLPSVPVVGARSDRGWRKLGLFGPELATVLDGVVLYLDLDIVVTAPLDPFFEHTGDFLIIKDYKRFRYRHRFAGNSSVLRFTSGSHTALLGEVLQRGESIRMDFRDEQEFLSDYMRRHGLLQYWPRGWCVSYKHDCVRPIPSGLWSTPTLPTGSKIVVFHGRPKPDEAVSGSGSKWYRPLKPAPWLKIYME